MTNGSKNQKKKFLIGFDPVGAVYVICDIPLW